MWAAPVAEEDKRPISRTTVRRVVAIFRPYRRQVAVVGAAIVVSSSLGVVNPLMIAKIFNDALFGPNTGPDVGMCSGQPCPNLHALWTRPVHVETIVDEHETILSYDGTQHSSKGKGELDVPH